MPTELPPKNVGDHTSTRGISGLAPRVVRGRAHSKGGAVEGVYLVKKNELSCNQLMRKARKGTPPDLSDSTARRPLVFFSFFVCFMSSASARVLLFLGLSWSCNGEIVRKAARLSGGC